MAYAWGIGCHTTFSRPKSFYPCCSIFFLIIVSSITAVDTKYPSAQIPSCLKYVFSRHAYIYLRTKHLLIHVPPNRNIVFTKLFPFGEYNQAVRIITALLLLFSTGFGLSESPGLTPGVLRRNNKKFRGTINPPEFKRFYNFIFDFVLHYEQHQHRAPPMPPPNQIYVRFLFSILTFWRLYQTYLYYLSFSMPLYNISLTKVNIY